MLKVAITGSSGFIATHLYKNLRRKFYFVKFSRKKNLKYKFINDYSKIDKDNFNFLLYLSEEADSNIFNNYSRNKISKNQSVLKKISKKFKNRVIYFSSAAIYSDKSKIKLKENFKTYPSTKYSANKIVCEKIVKKYNGIILRLTNIVGRNMPSRNIVTTVMKQISKKKKIITIHNKFPVRDFLHIDDLIDLVEKILTNPKSGTFNVGSGKGIKIENLVKEIIKKKKIKSKLLSINNKKFFSKKILNIEKTKRTFNWMPKIRILEDINKII